MWLSAVPMEHPVFEEARWYDARWQHRQVMQLFGDFGGGSQARQQAGALFRVEPAAGSGRVLLQTTMRPEADGLAVKDASPLLSALKPGVELRFAARVNPVKTVNRDRPDGRVKQSRAALPDGDVPGWLGSRLDGFELVTVGVRDRRTDRLGAGPGELVTVETSGLLRVVDGVRAATTLTEGVGRAKAYGCGLVAVAPG